MEMANRLIQCSVGSFDRHKEWKGARKSHQVGNSRNDLRGTGQSASRVSHNQRSAEKRLSACSGEF